MKEQIDLIKMFRELYKNPSYSRMGSLLQIQKTRAFRICNGHEMKLSEYLMMQDLINEKTGKSKLQALIDECLLKLPANKIDDISTRCQRYLTINSMLTQTADISITASFAS